MFIIQLISNYPVHLRWVCLPVHFKLYLKLRGLPSAWLKVSCNFLAPVCRSPVPSLEHGRLSSVVFLGPMSSTYERQFSKIIEFYYLHVQIPGLGYLSDRLCTSFTCRIFSHDPVFDWINSVLYCTKNDETSRGSIVYTHVRSSACER